VTVFVGVKMIIQGSVFAPHFRVTQRREFRLALISLIVLLLHSCGTTPPLSLPASWQMQLQSAQEKATQLDPKATLLYVTAGDPGRTGTLEVHFIFARPSGTVVVINLEDTRVAESLQMKTDTWTETFPTPTEQAQLAQALATVRLSPAEVVQQTVTLRQDFAQRYHSEPATDIVLALQPVCDSSAVWIVRYYAASQKIARRVLVDAQTGTILDQAEGSANQVRGLEGACKRP
jgi:hypothetical protein